MRSIRNHDNVGTGWKKTACRDCSSVISSDAFMALRVISLGMKQKKKIETEKQ
jgi:hypothetical protein